MEIAEGGNFGNAAGKNRYGTSKQQIINAAERLFAERGFARTTLRDVAKASGANTALVGYYFGGKEGLRKAVADAQVAKCQSVLDDILNSEDAVTFDVLTRVLKSLFDFLRSDKLIYQLQTWAIVDGGEFARQMAESLWLPMYIRFKILVSRYNQELRGRDLEIRSLMLSRFVHQYAHLRWNYLEYVNLDHSQQEILEDFETIFYERVIPALLN